MGEWMSWENSASINPERSQIPTPTVLTTCSSHHTCIRTSSVSSGWKLVPMALPCRTATILFTSPPCTSDVISSGPPLTLFVLSGSTPRISTVLVTDRVASPCSSLSSDGDDEDDNNCSTMGARMKTPGNGAAATVESAPERRATDWAKKGNEMSATKLSTWRPKWFRWTRTSSPPMSSWPPFLVALACSARRMSPAQVPQVGLREDLEGEFRQSTLLFCFLACHLIHGGRALLCLSCSRVGEMWEGVSVNVM